MSATKVARPRDRVTTEAAKSSGGGVWWFAGVGLIYIAGALLVTYPVIRHLGDRIAGSSSDIFIYPWGAWWIRESIRHADALFYTPFLYFPDGASLAFHNLVAPMTGWILLLPSSVNLIAFYNVLVIASYVLSAIAAYLLAFFVTRSHPAGLIGGLIFGFAPYRVEQARSHLTTIAAPWLPLFVLAFLWLCRAPSRRQRALAVLVGAVSGFLALLTRADHLISGVYILGILLMYPPFARADLGWRGRLGRIVAVGLCTAVLASPYLSIWLRHDTIPKTAGWEAERQGNSVSLENLVTPAPGSLLWGRWVTRPESTREHAKVAFLGFVVLALLAAGAYRVGRERAWRFWTVCGLFFVAASLGPRLVLGEQVSGIPLIYNLLPGIDEVRNPRRFMTAAMLCFAMAVAISWRAWLAGAGDRARRWWLAPTLALGALLLLEDAAPPLAMVEPKPSPFYRQVAASAETFGLIEIPSNTRMHDKIYMFYQTMHGKPIHAGHMGRIPDETFHFIRAVGLLNYAAREGHVPRPGPVNVSADLDILRANNFRYIIFHRRFDEGPEYVGINQREKRLMTAVGQAIGPATYRDDLVTVFDIRRPPRAGIELQP